MIELNDSLEGNAPQQQNAQAQGNELALQEREEAANVVIARDDEAAAYEEAHGGEEMVSIT